MYIPIERSQDFTDQFESFSNPGDLDTKRRKLLSEIKAEEAEDIPDIDKIAQLQLRANALLVEFQEVMARQPGLSFDARKVSTGDVAFSSVGTMPANGKTTDASGHVGQNIEFPKEQKLVGFEYLPDGVVFQSKLPELGTVTLTKFMNSDGRVEAINAWIKYPFPGNDGYKTVTGRLYTNGQFGIELPAYLESLGISRQQIRLEVLHALESLDLNQNYRKWYSLDLEVLPPGPYPALGEGIGLGRPEQEDVVIDYKRLRLFTEHSAFLFGVIPQKRVRSLKTGAFGDYYILMFEGGVVLESEVVGNRTYWKNFEAPLSDKIIRTIKTSRGLSKDELVKLLEDEGVLELTGSTKYQLRVKGYGHRSHPPHEDLGEWNMYALEIKQILDVKFSRSKSNIDKTITSSV